MAFSKFLDSKRQIMKELVLELRKTYDYVSILGSDIQGQQIVVDRRSAAIRDDGESECGFVIKLSNGGSFFEYSLDDIFGDVKELAAKIVASLKISKELEKKMVKTQKVADEPFKKDFVRESDFEKYSPTDLLNAAQEIKNLVLAKEPKALNVYVLIGTFEVSKIFISENKEMSQNYTWVNGLEGIIYQENGKMARAGESANYNNIKDVLTELPQLVDHLVDKVHHLVHAKPIVPGVYDVITDTTITGLIAHEAFGHGVEMDQFVKDRALAKEFVGKYVASPILNMRDGAASTLSVASYFFDDDGVLAHDTQIIKDGILVSGLSDLVSASELKTIPTGNGRRESYKRKAYTRMTNTFFEKGTDKLEDMIKSIKHGYMLFETDNGMEDPKNWSIQCTAQYGIEIVDGKLTDNYVAPVVLSGYVPDVLKSITMISDDFKVVGAGHCGKGYKEWVRVSDGGPALKARVKLS